MPVTEVQSSIVPPAQRALVIQAAPALRSEAGVVGYLNPHRPRSNESFPKAVVFKSTPIICNFSPRGRAHLRRCDLRRGSRDFSPPGRALDEEEEEEEEEEDGDDEEAGHDDWGAKDGGGNTQPMCPTEKEPHGLEAWRSGC